MRLREIKTFKHGATTFTTLKEVDYSEGTNPIEDSGDDDAALSYQEGGLTTCGGSVLIADPVQALAIKAAARADITFVGIAQSGGTNQLVTIKGAKFFEMSPRFMHNGVSVTRLTFRCAIIAPAVLPFVTIANAA